MYNQEAYIAEAIGSVLSQTYKDFELIVVDDGSTDRTPEIIATYGNSVKRLRQRNQGTASALNLGIAEAQGPWIGWLSSDDVWEPDKLKRQIEAINHAGLVGVCHTDSLVIDPNGKVCGRRRARGPTSGRRLMLSLLRNCYINGSSTLVHRRVFERVGLFDEKNRLAFDYDLWLRAAPYFEFMHIPEPLVRYRIHPGQISARPDALELSAKQVASRALRSQGAFWGALAASARLLNEMIAMPWQLRNPGASHSLPNRIRALGLSVRLLLNADR